MHLQMFRSIPDDFMHLNDLHILNYPPLSNILFEKL